MKDAPSTERRREPRGCARSRRQIAASAACMLLAVASIVGCRGAPERAEVTTPEGIVSGPAALRGTIGRDATLRRATPTYVSGYGLVVGLKGRGATDVPDSVAATMEREILTLSGGQLGFENTPFDGLSPRQILRHPDTAVVFVEGAVPPGGPESMRFDVRVSALRGSTAETLEGGVLWTTRLQIGPPITLGGPQTEIVGEARGEVFLNPFAEPGQSGPDSRTGRVLGGGVLTDPQPLELILENPLHSRATAIARAINQRFPTGPRGEGTTAFGRDDQVIQVYTPDAYRARFDEFVNLLLATPINQNFPEELARRYTRALVAQPELAEELSWALRAIGPRAKGFVRDLYDFPERSPRLAALTVGAHLNDERAAVFLERLAVEGDRDDRLIALELLGVMSVGGASNTLLREVAGFGEDLTVRVAAYEALMKRAERERFGRLIEAERDRFGSRRSAQPEQLALAAELRIPPGNPQGVERINVGGRFSLDLLPFGEPMLYVTQQGRPRIAVFGAQAELERPLLVDAWSSRLLITAQDQREPIRLRYETAGGERIITQQISPRLADLVIFLARGASASDFGPGLGLSYSQVVGALAAIEQDGGTAAAFATETDRLRALLLAAADRRVTDRPALLDDPSTTVDLNTIGEGGLGERAALEPEDRRDAEEGAARPSYVVAVPRKTESGEDPE